MCCKNCCKNCCCCHTHRHCNCDYKFHFRQKVMNENGIVGFVSGMEMKHGKEHYGVEVMSMGKPHTHLNQTRLIAVSMTTNCGDAILSQDDLVRIFNAKS